MGEKAKYREFYYKDYQALKNKTHEDYSKPS